MNQQTNRLSKNTIILLLNNISTAALVFALTVIITRGLGDAALGQYAAVMAWVLPLTVWVDFGISTLITRDVAQNRAQARHYLHLSYPLRLMVGVSTISIVQAAATWMSDDPFVVLALRIGIWLVLIDALFGSYTAIFRAWEIMWPILVLNVGLLVLQIFGALLIVVWGGDVSHLLLVIVGADLTQLVATWFVWRYLQNRISISGENPMISYRQMMRGAYPFAVAGVLAVLQTRVVIILLDQFDTSAAVGWYAAASRLVEAARMAPSALFVALFPRLASLVNDQVAFQRLFRRASVGVFIYAVIIGLLSFVGARSAIRLIFGAAFDNSVAVLMILAWALVPGLLRALLTLQLYAYKQEQRVNLLIGLALAFQIAVGLVLIPAYGPSGAAWTVVFGETVLMTAMLLIARMAQTVVRQPSS